MPSDRRRWQRLAKKEAYWASFPDQRFRSGNLHDANFEAFFESGERDMGATLATVREMLGTEFHPARALDFGCGAGRLTIPLARESRQVVAVDISPSMLEETEANCAERQITNVEFVDTRTFLRETSRRAFDFVQSYMVFQHIPPRHGRRLTGRILDMLRPGGVAALHYTYARDANIVRKSLHRARRLLPPLNVAANILQRRRFFEPVMPMYVYSLKALFDLFGSRRFSPITVQLTDHHGHKGAFFFLQKAR
jgi:2-polyprenyl-3-methyl-5-hydroxy-6-metoxy-1,4-benzoquinol methylase